MKNIESKPKAFTLIELLVIISIVVILTAIVSANLTYTKNKAKDVLIKAEMSSLKNKANSYFANNNNYKDLCKSQDFKNIGQTITTQSDLENSFFCNVNSKNDSFVICGYLPYNKKYWCIDSSGAEIEQDIKCENGVTACSI